MQLANIQTTLPNTPIIGVSAAGGHVSVGLSDGTNVALRLDMTSKPKQTKARNDTGNIKCFNTHPSVQVIAGSRSQLSIAPVDGPRTTLDLPFLPARSYIDDEVYLLWNDTSLAVATITDLCQGRLSRALVDLTGEGEAIIAVHATGDMTLTIATHTTGPVHTLTSTSYVLGPDGLNPTETATAELPGPPTAAATTQDITAVTIDCHLLTLVHSSGATFTRTLTAPPLSISVAAHLLAITLPGGAFALYDSAGRSVEVSATLGDPATDGIDISEQLGLHTHIAAVQFTRFSERSRALVIVCERGPVFCLSVPSAPSVPQEIGGRVKSLLLHARYGAALNFALSQPDHLVPSLAAILQHCCRLSSTDALVGHLSFAFRCLCVAAPSMASLITNSRADPAGGQFRSMISMLFLALLDHDLFEMAFAVCSTFSVRNGLVALMSRASAVGEPGVVDLCRVALELPPTADVTAIPVPSTGEAMNQLIVQLAAKPPAEMTDDEFCCLGAWYELNDRADAAAALYETRGMTVPRLDATVSTEISAGTLEPG